MHLNIFISQKCFLYCKGCYSFSRTEKCGQLVPSKIIVEFLRYAYNKGIDKVTLCGGDPLTRKDIINLLKQIKNIGYLISLDTVGTSIIKDIVVNDKIIINRTPAKEIAQLVDIIGIPLDGSTNDIFKLFRQTNLNLLEEQLNICEELHKYRGKICINTVVHKGNLHDAIALSNLIKKLSYIEKWQIFQYAPIGKFGILNREMFEISEEEFNDYKSRILKTFNNKNKVQFKAFKDRNNIYMLVDNSGNAWVPIYDKEQMSINNEERKIIGNITNINDWDNIVYYLKK